MLTITPVSSPNVIHSTSDMKLDTMYLDRMGEIVIKVGPRNEFITITKRGQVLILKSVDSCLPFTLFTGTISNA